MRIAIVSWNGRRVGGVETYLSAVIPELINSGHQVAFWHEIDEPADRDKVVSSGEVISCCVFDVGTHRALAELRDWRPDLIYCHKLESLELQAETLDIAPSVFFAHDYYGTCISGSKTFTFPGVNTCDRRFGWPCLVHYFPHRCGGLSPITMVKLYNLQSKRLDLLKRYDAIVTHSDHMLAEYFKHGFSPKPAYAFPYCSIAQDEKEAQYTVSVTSGRSSTGSVDRGDGPETSTGPCWRLLFSGRMEFLKGGRTFLDSLPKVAQTIDRPLQVTFVGDGRKSKEWQSRALEIRNENSHIQIVFAGWASETQMSELLDDCDLMVVPSLWPEPFGLVGVEAGKHAVPVAAFAVGGIRDWLEDGFNGHLATGNPATAEGLAGAIVKCLRDPAHHASLRRGAVVMSSRFSLKNHLSALERVFEKVLANRTSVGQANDDQLLARC